MSPASPLQPGWDQGFGKTLPSTTNTNVPTLWSGDTDAQNKVTSSANVTDLSWALSIELRKHRDVRLSDCPNRDLPKNLSRS